MTALKNNSKSTTEVPKSLQMLFEDNSEEQEDLAPPKAMSILWKEWNHQQLKSQTWTVFHNYPCINNKYNQPPTIKQTTGVISFTIGFWKFESRFSSLNTSPKDNGGSTGGNNGINRPRKETISNTGGTANAQFQQTSSAVPSYTTLYYTCFSSNTIT